MSTAEGCDTYALDIRRGKTERWSFGWAQPLRGYVAIVAATQAAPCVIEATAHALPEGWLFTITGAKGMTALNRKEPWTARVVDANHLELNDLNASAQPAYTGGGVMEFDRPVDLIGWNAELQIRESDTAAAPLLTLTSSPAAGIVIDPAGFVAVTFSAAQTAALVIDSGVYEIELTAPGGDKERLISGRVRVGAEIVR